MTYLELCQALRREVDMGGTSLPSAVTGQTLDLLNIVTWVAQAYTDIQSSRGGLWRWLLRKFYFDTVASTASYAFGSVNDTLLASAITRFNHWRINNRDGLVRMYLVSAGVGTETYLSYLDWDDFKRLYGIGTQTPGQPAHITIDPQNNLVLGPTPNAIYRVSGEYWRGPQILTADGDTPEMPSRFHMLIVWRAMTDHGWLKAAQEVLSRGALRESQLSRELRADQGPVLSVGGPLA